MPEYGFSLTRILPYKGRIYDFILIRENAGNGKPYSGIFFCSNRSKASLKPHKI